MTPDPLQYLLHDLFEVNTFWELETERVTAEQTDAGAWQVTLDVRARKVVVDESGVETEVPMNDSVEIGIFDDQGLNEPIYLRQHRIGTGRQTLTVTVPRPASANGSGAVSPKLREGGKPARAGIDPRYLLIDRDTGDNVTAVSVQN